MEIPVAVAFEGMEEDDAVLAAAWRHADELERFFDRITSCRIVVAQPHRRGRQGNLYEVRIDLTVPGREIIVNREHRFNHAHEDVYVAMRDAFRAARRQLEDHARRIRGQVKAREKPPEGRIGKLFPQEGYGFIAADDGREVYFHRNSIVTGDFDALTEGDGVWFAEEEGDRGPQASSVHVSSSSRRAEQEARR